MLKFRIPIGLSLLMLVGCGQQEPAQLQLGEDLYLRHCASCHGVELEGEPDWRQRGPDGRLPAPPHDASGHTWHHPDSMLFEVTRDGMVPPYAPEGYQSDMPGFGDRLDDAEIVAIIEYIKHQWTDRERAYQEALTRQSD